MAKSNSKSRLWLIVAIVAVVVAAVIAFLWCTDCFTNWNKYCQWGHDYDEYGICQRCGVEKDINADAEYFQIESEANGKNIIALSQINRKAYSVMGIPASVESAYTLTATLSPSNADNQRVAWTVEFVNPDSEWAKGKNPAQFVKAQPTVDGSNQATVTCLQAFSEPINVIASSEDNSGASASCLCDYVKRVVGMDLQISTNTLAFGTQYTVNATPQYGAGTIDGEYSVSGYRINLVPSIANALNSLTGESFSGKYRAKYVCSADTPAKINVNLDSRSFSFNGSDPFDVFGSYSSDMSGVVPTLVGPSETYEQAVFVLRSTVNNTFKEKVTEINGPHMVFTFDFTYTYQGQSFVQTTATANLKFDAETLAIHVLSLTLDNDHIVFMLPSNSVTA